MRIAATSSANEVPSYPRSQNRLIAASNACSRVWAVGRPRRREAPVGLWHVTQVTFATSSLRSSREQQQGRPRAAFDEVKLDAVGVNMPLREARKARHQVSDGGDEVCHVNLLIWKSLWRAGEAGQPSGRWAAAQTFGSHSRPPTPPKNAPGDTNVFTGPNCRKETLGGGEGRCEAGKFEAE